jgi:uncharacterized membrane protein (DUF4010 family)
VIISVSTLVKESISLQVAWIAVAICILANNSFKLLLTKQNGSKPLFNRLLINYFLMNAPLIIWLIFLI